MSDRWFDEDELQQMARPTMDRALEALDAGDLDKVRTLCEGMRYEWRYLHDLMAESMLGLVSFVQERLGDQGVADAWQSTFERGWRRDTGHVVDRDRRQLVDALAATWRAHSVSGVAPVPASFSIEEDDKKFTFRMHPCGSGQRLFQRGLYKKPRGYGTTHAAHDWSFHRKDFPLYCTHCSFMNELLPIRWYGAPLYPCDPPDDFDHDPCTWYWYKDPADIPDRHWARYGLTKSRSTA